MKKIFTLLFIIVSLTAFSQVRISQTFGGGGNAGSYMQDFVELFNAGASSVDISGWSVQYSSAAGSSWAVASIPALTSIGAGKYFLVGLSIGASGIVLPTPDLSVTGINMSSSAGKVALVNNSTALSGTTACTNAAVVDVVGYGLTASCYETSPVNTTGINTTLSVQRGAAGCAESNNNSVDFALVTTNPRNSASPANPCTSPLLSAGPNISGLITGFGIASAAQSFTLSGSNLTGFPANISVTATANFEVSLASGSGYATSINVPYTSAILSATLIYVRISATASLGVVSGTVKNSGGGALDADVPVTGNVLTSEPTTPATNVLLTGILDHGMNINWTNGNGTSRLVVIHETANAEVIPADGAVYTASTDITSAGTTGSGNYVVYNGTGTDPITVSGLTAGTGYTVRVYEFNGSAGSNNYLTSTATGNPNNASTTGISPLLQQINFTSISTPLYMGSGSASRTPTMFFAKVSNLTPNTIYRYFTQAAIATDLGTSSSGAGNSILINYTSPFSYTYASSPSIASGLGYREFTTNATGSFTGAFGFTNSANARFTAGNNIIPSITLSDFGSSTVLFRFALDQSITVLQFATTSGANDGTFIKGASSAIPGNLVGLWKSVDGSSLISQVSARPLSMTLSENPTIATGNGGSAWGTSFITGYDLSAGSWNTIIPNSNANGVRLIQQFNIASGVVIGCNADADGTWATGTVITSNPTGGTTALQLSVTDAPINGGVCFDIIPIKLSSFNVQKINNIVKLNWITSQEINSKEFIIERSANGTNWTAIATIPAAGNSNIKLNYTTSDNSPVKGINYYRIKQVDLDSKFEYSATKAVLFNTAYEIMITPNPATNFINIYLDKNNNRSINIQLIDASGKIIRSMNADQPHVQINTAGIERGSYYVKVIDEENVTVSKVVLQ